MSSSTEVPGFAEAAQIALGASIFRFSNDESHFKAEVVDPQKVVAQLVAFSRQRKFYRDIDLIYVPQPLSRPTVFYHDMILEFLLRFYGDII